MWKNIRNDILRGPGYIIGEADPLLHHSWPEGREDRIQILQLLKERAYDINRMAEDLNLN